MNKNKMQQSDNNKKAFGVCEHASMSSSNHNRC